MEQILSLYFIIYYNFKKPLIDYIMRIPKFRTFLINILALIICSCSDDGLFDGSVSIKGKLYDEYTNIGVPDILVTVDAISSNGLFGTRAEVGSFVTNSLGEFSTEIKTLPDASRYEFFIQGDTTHYSSTIDIDTEDFEYSASNLNFAIHLLTDLTINLEKITQTEINDTLYLSWGVINIVYGPFFDCDVINYENIPDNGFRWVGGNVKSTIRTKTIANKEIEIILNLYRNGIQEYIKDTFYCERNIQNVINFKY